MNTALIIFIIISLTKLYNECQVIDSRSMLDIKSYKNEKNIETKTTNGKIEEEQKEVQEVEEEMEEEEEIETTEEETTPATTTTEAKTTSPVSSNECKLIWKRYDPLKNPLDPTTDGLILGNYIDGSPIYVGRGSSTFFRRFTLPARVNISTITSEAGVYVVSYPTEFRDISSTSQYLVTNENCNYMWISSSEAQYVNNAVGWTLSGYNITIARINFTMEDGTIVTQIGASVTAVGTIYYNPIMKSVSTMGLKAYETLIYLPKNVKYEQELCVFQWKSYDPIKHPKAPIYEGLLIGTYFDNTPVYLGRGNDVCYAITPARVNVQNVTKEPGVYTSCDDEELMDNSESAEYLVKDSRYTYSWINASSDEQILNAVKWSYFSDSLSVSRIKVFNPKTNEYFMTIGKTFIGIGTWYYNPMKQYTETLGKRKVEMLICSPNGSTQVIKAISRGCVHNWKQFDYELITKIDINDGIIAGNYIDGAPIFVGSGFQSYINDIVPARITTSGFMEPGAYVCGNKNEMLDRGLSAGYLMYNDSQSYQWVKTKPKYYVQNQIEMTGLYYTYTIARVNLTDDKRNRTYSQIGTNYMGVATYYYNPVMEKVQNITLFADFIEVLTCSVKK